jgi:acyl-CoA thioesterase-1
VVSHLFLPFRVLATLPCRVLLISLLISSCGSDKLQPLPSDAIILAFGDSLTYGVGVKPEFSYPTQLAQLTGLQVINAGVSGEVTTDGLLRLEKKLSTLQPDLIILLEGGNDILRNQSFKSIKDNLSKMIALAEKDNIPVILIGVPKKNLFSDTASFYSELAEQHQVIFDDETIGELIRTPSMKSDSVHFNRAGYSRLAENIYQLIHENGGL